ncbi:MAG: ATP-binding protein [Egibacteraceae bacterium]
MDGTERSAFVGRRADLDRLQRHLDAVVATGRGRLLSVRGRRQAGKSRLVTEFVRRSGLPQLFFTASRQPSVQADLNLFAADVARESTLPGAELFSGVAFDSWEAALRVVAGALPDGPALVVVDEFPWLIENEPGLEGSLQKLWDTVFEARSVLFVLIGSDLSMMEALTAYGRPLFGRAKELVVHPFTVADAATMIGLDDPAAAIDAYLVTGGYPRLVSEWPSGQGMWEFLTTQLADENSDLLVVGQRVLSSEFPAWLQARRVLGAIGAGERAYKAIADVAGVGAAPLGRALRLLIEDKRLVALDRPVSTRPSRESRYRVADPYLRFWLRFVDPGVADVARGRGDLTLTRIRDSWSTYRGRAVEPLVREALARLALVDERLRGAGHVGGYWTRTNDPEVDLVGVDRHPDTRRVCFVGSIKWEDRKGFATDDLSRLARHRALVPGGDQAALVAVSRSGGDVAGLDAIYTAKDIVDAWA